MKQTIPIIYAWVFIFITGAVAQTSSNTAAIFLLPVGTNAVADAGQPAKRGSSCNLYGGNNAYMGSVRSSGNSTTVHGSQNEYQGRIVQMRGNSFFFDEHNIQKYRTVTQGSITYYYYYYDHTNALVARAEKQGNTTYYYDGKNALLARAVTQGNRVYYYNSSGILLGSKVCQ